VPEPLGSAPNILIIVTDDQRIGHMGVMPQTRQLFKEEGVTFSNGYVTTPLCCPSRTSIFTGQYAHNHGITKNAKRPVFDQSETIERYLQDSGYRTAISGKFLNSWPLEENPPYFDRWSIFRSGYYGTMFNVEGEQRSVEEYSTDFVGSQALSYLDEFETTDVQPWFMQISPGAPHKPFTSAERHRDSPVAPWPGSPAVKEKDRTDKPLWVRERARRDRRARRIWIRQQRTLIAVDELIGSVFQKLEALGEDEETLAFFISDNGYLHGEHGLVGKRFPYTDSIKVPFLMRWPGTVEPGVDDRIALNIDITPTIMDVVDLPTEPEPLPVDGLSLLGEDRHEYIYTEQWGNPNKGMPDWSSIRTENYHYIQYFILGYTSGREYYNLREDPWQLNNIFGDKNTRNNPGRADSLRDLIHDFRSCAGPEDCP
jgi:arylsulfatase A-like enzyme